MSLKKKIVNNDNYNSENIMIESFKGNDYQRINLYYGSLQKIWIKTPKLKVMFMPNINNQTKNISLTVALFPLIDEINDFYKLISKIDRKVKKSTDHKFLSSINKNDEDMYKMYLGIPMIKVNNEFKTVFNTYDRYNKKIDINNITNLSTISAYIELDYIWYDGTKVGIHWSILQLKHYPVNDFITCVFTDCEEDPNDRPQKILKSNIPLPPPPPLPPQLHMQPIQKKEASTFIPSCSELLDMRKKLKKS